MKIMNIVKKMNGGSDMNISKEDWIDSYLRLTKRSIDHDESAFEENKTTNKERQ